MAFGKLGDKFGSLAASHRGALGDRSSSHQAVILRHTYAEGQVKVYVDSKGLAEKTEISLDEGKIVVIKDYEIVETLVHYKKIEVYTIEGTLRFTIDIVSEDRNMPNPAYRFYYLRSELGRGYGDIAVALAEKLLGRNLTVRNANTMLDDEVVTTIKDLIKNKQI